MKRFVRGFRWSDAREMDDRINDYAKDYGLTIIAICESRGYGILVVFEKGGEEEWQNENG
jgi:hypothetical protein